jgi:hypothetical protein
VSEKLVQLFANELHSGEHVLARIRVRPEGSAISMCRVERSDGRSQSRRCNSRFMRTVMATAL